MSSNSKFSRRQFLAGALALAGGSVLAGCTGVPVSAPADTASSAASDQTTDAPAAEEITLLFHSRLGTHADWHKSRVELFEEQHPGLKLEIDELPGEEMYPKIYSLAATGTVGDVVWTYLNNPPEHKAKKVMVPLDDIIAAKGYDTSPFWDALLQAVTLDGELHALPNHGHYGTTAYYINKTLIQEAGLEVPTSDWTVEELLDIAAATTSAPDTWGMRASGVGQEHIPSYLRTFGGDAINEEGTTSLFDRPESVAALKWLYDLQHTNQVDPCLCGDQVHENFVAGKVAIYNTTTGRVGTYKNMADAGELEFEWDAIVSPVGPDGLRGSQVSAAAFCVTENSKHPAEAFDVLAFYGTKEDGIEHVLFGAGSPGGRKDVWESDELNAIHPIFRQHQEIYPDGPRKWHRPANARTQEFVDTMDNNLQAIWTDAVGFDEGVQQTHDLVQEILDKDSLV